MFSLHPLLYVTVAVTVPVECCCCCGDVSDPPAMASVTGSAPDDDHTNTAVTDHPYVSMDDEAGLLVLDTAEGEVDLMDMTSELEKILDLTVRSRYSL